MKTKKGDIFQILYVLIILMVIAVLGLLVGTLSYKVTEAYKDSGLLEETPEGQEVNQLIQDTAIPLFDFFVFLFFLGSNIALILSATRTNFSPVLIFIFIMLLLLEIFIAAGFVNIYQGFREDPELAPVPDRMTLTNIIFSEFTPLIFGLIGAVILIVMYGKSGADISP